MAGAAREPTVTDADLVLGRLDTERFASGRLQLDLRRRHRRAGPPGSEHRPRRRGDRRRHGDAGRRPHDRRHPPRPLAGRRRSTPARPRRLRWHGWRARHDAGRRARHAPGARAPCRPRVSPPSVCSPPITSSTTPGGTSSPGRKRTWTTLTPPGRGARRQAPLAELADAGVPDERIRLEWSILLVYPGQTFDVAIPVDAPTDVAAAVAEFHRRNEEARLIEARAQEPIVRGHPPDRRRGGGRDRRRDPRAGAGPAPLGHRDMWAGDGWQRGAPYYDFAALAAGLVHRGPGRRAEPVHHGDPAAGGCGRGDRRAATSSSTSPPEGRAD